MRPLAFDLSSLAGTPAPAPQPAAETESKEEAAAKAPPVQMDLIQLVANRDLQIGPSQFKRSLFGVKTYTFENLLRALR